MTNTLDQDTNTQSAPQGPTLDHWINGRPVAPQDGKRVPGTNPADGTVAAMIAVGTVADVDAAVASSVAAASGWRWMPSLERGRLLNDLARAMRAQSAELAALESRDTGKPTHVALAEVETSAQYFEFYGGLTGLPVGETLDIAPDQHVYTLREPYGVIGVITPWNVPLTQAARAAAPAVVAGNTVVIKPAETSSSTTVALARLATEVGFPPGVINVVTGSGSVVGTAIVNHPDIAKVAFTGSVRTGRTIGHLAAERIIPLTLELGGKSANIIFGDAGIDEAVDGAIKGFTTNAGQICSSGTRLLVHRSIHDEVVSKLVAKVEQIRPGVDMGPIITRSQFTEVQSYLEIAAKEGAVTATGGTVAADPALADGFYITPTVYTGVDNTMRIAQEEIFGPVLVVIPFDTDDEAVRIANDSEYGLVAGVWTADISRAITVSERIQAGQVFVNTWSTNAVQTPFGGWKNSGYGREKGIESLNHYSQIKCVTIKLNRPFPTHGVPTDDTAD
jgi:aldehyde dehydrogenase (NAD+)